MRILLASAGGIGCWMLLRLQREGHQCDWFEIEPEPRHGRVLKGLIPSPLKSEPDYSQYDLCIFDCTGSGDLAEEIAKVTPVIGDSDLATRLEDDRLFGIETMESVGIEVPPYARFSTPDQAKSFLLSNPRRYVFKPFVMNGEEQDCDTTYVSESAEDLLKSIDAIWADSHNSPFLLQEVVEGTEISTEGYFDGQFFHLLNHTLEEKKFMSGGYGPNTGCSGNLIWSITAPDRLAQELVKLTPFLRDSNYRGPIDLNTIVNESHCYGLEFTPRFGYDASPSLFSTLDGSLAQFFLDIITAPDDGWIDHNPVPFRRSDWAASKRLTTPPYPEEQADFPDKLPVKGIDVEGAWRNCYLWDVMMDTHPRTGDDGLVTVGINGIVACPISSAHTPEGAWKGLERMMKPIKFPNMQCRDDVEFSTLKRLEEVRQMGWVG